MKKDIEAGIVTDEDVLELFELIRIKDFHLGTVQSKDNRGQTNGEAKWHNIVIGGVKHIQFNIVDEKELLDARVHPENHEDLMVRVA
ncbi:pyruvate-formate lyase [Catenibacillus scindens]|uniref:Pyruvate-formate lyase n=1 Tax=Catenibacillus scindens TaxID=673271 RepID=A0A7W8HEP9_9FIRM|nr:pyruvate-formate lyase [Catenibacillus scindens]